MGVRETKTGCQGQKNTECQRTKNHWVSEGKNHTGTQDHKKNSDGKIVPYDKSPDKNCMTFTNLCLGK